MHTTFTAISSDVKVGTSDWDKEISWLWPHTSTDRHPFSVLVGTGVPLMSAGATQKASCHSNMIWWKGLKSPCLCNMWATEWTGNMQTPHLLRCLTCVTMMKTAEYWCSLDDWTACLLSFKRHLTGTCRTTEVEREKQNYCFLRCYVV